MDLMDVSKFPLDFESLRKGDYISPDTVEHIVRVNRDKRRYGIAVMKLQERIEQELRDRGLEVVTRQEKEGIRILDDAAAAVYLDNKFRLRMDAMRLTHGKAMTVDTTQLDDDVKRQHENRLHVNGWTLKAMYAGRREAFKTLPHQRTVPGLAEPA